MANSYSNITNRYEEANLGDNQCRESIDSMMTALVERAIRDALGTTQIERHVVIEARQWLHDTSTKEWSFRWITEHLQLTPTFIKRIHTLLPR